MHLRQGDVGRVAVMVDGHPEIFPVNSVVDAAGDIFFRTDPGTKLDGAARADVISFESSRAAGSTDPSHHSKSVPRPMALVTVTTG
jgi:nitroimidazol reductase NimA-like FMN-containing flavoprotein (pyridoxamine 5'-phosphate oxidase superfamily)